MFEIANDVKVVDADSHWTPTHDLWTKRAPAGYKDRVLHVEQVDGQNMWVMDGEVLDPVRGGGVVSKDNEKFPMLDAMPWGNEEVHHGAWDTNIRLQVMDDCGMGLIPGVIERRAWFEAGEGFKRSVIIGP